MVRTLLIISFSILFSIRMYAQPEAYKIYDSNGKEVKYSSMVDKSASADLVLFGELHDNPIAHWLQLELLTSLYQKKSSAITAGAEMFEADNQLILDEYLSGRISEKSFTAEAKIWPNYKTDYRPLLEFCKSKRIRFIATNVPRRYASMVYMKGVKSLDTLDQQAKAFLPPLPFPYDPELKTYKEIFSGAGHGGANLPLSQALKDAMMAASIIRNLVKGNTFIHFNGSYHSNYGEGIGWYVKKYQPSISVITISVVEQGDVMQLEKENSGLADFIIVVDKDMTKTQQ